MDLWFRLEKTRIVRACLDVSKDTGRLLITCPKFYQGHGNIALSEIVKGRRGTVDARAQSKGTHKSQGMSGCLGKPGELALKRSSYFTDRRFPAVLIGVPVELISEGNLLRGEREGGLGGIQEVTCLLPGIYADQVAYTAIFDRYGGCFESDECAGWGYGDWVEFITFP